MVEISKLPLCRISRSLTMGIEMISVPRKWNSGDDEMRESPCPVPSVHTDTGHKGAVSHATEVIDLLD